MNYKDINQQNEILTIQQFYLFLEKLEVVEFDGRHRLYYNLRRYWKVNE